MPESHPSSFTQTAYEVVWSKNHESPNGLEATGRIADWNSPSFVVEVRMDNREQRIFLTTRGHLPDQLDRQTSWTVNINRTNWFLNREAGSRHWETELTFSEREWLLNPIYMDEVSAADIANFFEVDSDWFWARSDNDVQNIMFRSDVHWIRRTESDTPENRWLSVEDANWLVQEMWNSIFRRPEPLMEEAFAPLYDTVVERLNNLRNNLGYIGRLIPNDLSAIEEAIASASSEALSIGRQYLTEQWIGNRGNPAQNTPAQNTLEEEVIIWPHMLSGDVFYELTPPDTIDWLGGRPVGKAVAVVVNKPEDIRLKLWVRPNRWSRLPDRFIFSGAVVIDKGRFYTSDNHLYQVDLTENELNEMLGL